MPVQTQMQVRRGTASSWTSTNPTLAAGEIGLETDTGKFKIGNGSSTWTGLAYNLNGGTPSGTDIPLSTVTTKGDLVAGTGSSAVSRLAAGNNGDTLVADSSATTGLRYIPYGSPNFLINGNFDWWQRGTTSSANSGYLADRWTFDGSNCARSQQTTGAPDGARYYMRNTITSSGYGTTIQVVETQQCAAMWGRTITYSVRVRRSSTYSGSVTIRVRKNATVDASAFTAGYTSIADLNVTNAQLPTGTTSADWFFASVTVAVPNDGTANTLTFWVETVGTSTGGYWEMAQAQVEIGSTATQFRRAGGTIQGELAACQRYYFRTSGTDAYKPMTISSFCVSSTIIASIIPLPVQMRISPTVMEYGGAIQWLQSGGSSATPSSYAVSLSSTNLVNFNATSSGLTVNQFGYFRANNDATAYFAFTAELQEIKWEM